MNTLHELALRQYTGHYARMNPTLNAEEMPERVYRNMEMMFGSLVNCLFEGEDVVDIGCGAGFLLHWLSRKPSLHLQGVDACEGQTILARRAAPDATIVCGNALEFLKERRAMFAGAFCMDVLEHMDDADCLTLLQDARDALKPGGFFVCRVPNAAHVLGSYSRYLDITHRRSFTGPSLIQALEAVGFSQVRLIPTRSSVLLGRLRLALEYALHRVLFLICGHSSERTFTQNVIAVGLK